VGQQAAEAKELALPDAPQAAESLKQAEAHSEEAKQQAEKGNTPAAKEAQKATAKALDQAADQLTEAQKQLAPEAGQQFQQQTQESQQSTQNAIAVDPTATEALQSAENQARAAARPNNSPEQAAAADQGVQQSLEQAAASLAAMQQALQQASTGQANGPPEQGHPDQAARENQPAKDSGHEIPKHEGAPRSINSDARSTIAAGEVDKPGDRLLRNEPWFAKLPPEVRNAIRTGSQRTPPRGYEDRLQRYFQNRE
jgi:hypothetical protein